MNPKLTKRTVNFNPITGDPTGGVVFRVLIPSPVVTPSLERKAYFNEVRESVRETRALFFSSDGKPSLVGKTAQQEFISPVKLEDGKIGFNLVIQIVARKMVAPEIETAIMKLLETVA